MGLVPPAFTPELAMDAAARAAMSAFGDEEIDLEAVDEIFRIAWAFGDKRGWSEPAEVFYREAAAKIHWLTPWDHEDTPDEVRLALRIFIGAARQLHAYAMDEVEAFETEFKSMSSQLHQERMKGARAQRVADRAQRLKEGPAKRRAYLALQAKNRRKAEKIAARKRKAKAAEEGEEA